MIRITAIEAQQIGKLTATWVAGEYMSKIRARLTSSAVVDMHANARERFALTIDKTKKMLRSYMASS